MKKKLFSSSIYLFIAFLSVFIIACDSDSSTKSSKDLDSKLYGTWVFVDSENEVFSWTFKSNGTCIQSVYGIETEWKWTIESEKLKIFITGGLAHYKTYMIEGNLLYFYVDEISDWGIPFTKQ